MDIEGCVCQQCGLLFQVDVLVTNKLWSEIGMPDRGGLLCGRYIIGRIEAKDEYNAYRLIGLDESPAVDLIFKEASDKTVQYQPPSTSLPPTKWRDPQ